LQRIECILFYPDLHHHRRRRRRRHHHRRRRHQYTDLTASMSLN